MKLGHVSLDGTKVNANASKHKAMSYGGMKEEQRLEAEVKELLKRAQQVDEEEAQRYGKGKRGDELPQELAFRESRLKKMREAKEALEAEAGEAADRAQRNFTDLGHGSCRLQGARISCRHIMLRQRWTALTRSSWPLMLPTSPRTRDSWDP